MINADGLHKLVEKVIVFSHTLQKGSPYRATTPRNHESIFFVTKGNLLYEKDGVCTVISKGQVGYIAKGSVDTSGACDDSVSYIAVNFGFGENTLPLPFDTVCSKGLHREYERLFKDLNKAATSDGVGQSVVSQGIVLQLLGLILEESVQTEGGIKNIKKIKNGVKMLVENYDDAELKISRLAEASNLSTRQFRRVFVKVYGKNPYEYLQAYRIEQAKILLENTGSSVTEVSFACGFSDVYSFSHSFKAATGRSPTEYMQRR